MNILSYVLSQNSFLCVNIRNDIQVEEEEVSIKIEVTMETTKEVTTIITQEGDTINITEITIIIIVMTVAEVIITIIVVITKTQVMRILMDQMLHG